MARRRKKSMFYKKPRWKWLARIIEMDDPPSARAATQKLLSEFRKAKTRDKKRRIKQAVVLAANRAEAAAKRRNLSAKEKRELRQIARIYREAAKKMTLPGRRGRK